jgi:hypothetical protein
MRLDAVVLQPELIWLATEEDKVAFFGLMAPSLPRGRLPHVTVGQGDGGRLRLFPDDQPIGVRTTGRVVFTYLVTAYETKALRAFVQRHADLLKALPGWTLRLVLPQQLADSAARFESAVRDELTPLRPALLAELKCYFAKRRSTPNPRALSLEDPDFWQHQAAFSSPRFQQLYGRWLTDGDAAFEALATPANTEALEWGTGKIESRILLLSNRHLAPLVSLFRSSRKGVEGYIVRTVSTPSLAVALGVFRVPCVPDASLYGHAPSCQRLGRWCAVERGGDLCRPSSAVPSVQRRSRDVNDPGWVRASRPRTRSGSFTSRFSRRADLTPVYAMIFRRLLALGGDWEYHFPQLYLTDIGPRDLGGEQVAGYSVTESAVADLEAQKRRAETACLRADVDEMNFQAREDAMDRELPATVRAYRQVYGRDPRGWPPA